MSGRRYRPYQGRRSGTGLMLAGGAVLFCSLAAYLLSPFSVRKFAAFPAILGVFLVLFGLTGRCAPETGRLLRRGLAAVAALGVAGFGVLEGVILAGARDELRGEPDVVVVLGAQVHEWGPSVLLADRLDAAFAYLEDHPDLPVVVTGGRGPDEPAAEASVMRDYLVERGLDPGRIWLEEEAHNTAQNLTFTRSLLEARGFDLEETHLLVVSNGFHLARVRMLAERQGLDISTLAAPASHALSLFQSCVREAPALVKSWLLDR